MGGDHAGEDKAKCLCSVGLNHRGGNITATNFCSATKTGGVDQAKKTAFIDSKIL